MDSPPRPSHFTPPQPFGWFAGMALLIACGWGLLYAAYRVGDELDLAKAVTLVPAAAASLGLLLWLESGFWLTRLMGLRMRPTAVPWRSAVLLWLGGPAWLFVRGILFPEQPEDDPAGAKKPAPPRDPAREVVETIVFVVVLVLLLKLFVTEAFVIPTGSMAETLYGYQKIIDCPKCSHEFPVNAHGEVEGMPPDGEKTELVRYTCPNCRYTGRVDELNPYPQNRTGDRVLVLKPIYHLKPPTRGDVVVFKYPTKPQENQTAQNYIKRAMGFGGETVAVHRGELWTTTALTYPEGVTDDNGFTLFPRPDNPADLWQSQYMYANAAPAVALFDANRKAGFPAGPENFGIVRKPDDQVLACKRIVWDNDQPPRDRGVGIPPRWRSEGGGKWAADSPAEPKVFTHTGDTLDWLRYQNLIFNWNDPQQPPVPTVTTNFLAYNAGQERNRRTGVMLPARNEMSDAERMWVGDLILECEAQISGPDDAVVVELSRGHNRFQAKFEGGKVTLTRVGPNGGELATRPTRMTRAGKYRLRVANVDCKLRVWVDERPIDFGTDNEYVPFEPDTYDPNDKLHEGWTTQNDVNAPAGVAAKGGVTVKSLKVFRDIYYTHQSRGFRSEQDQPETYYVQPGHFLCLGDNSAQSSDSRTWGAVPERLMLGKAVFVFWPLYPPPNRTGLIR